MRWLWLVLMHRGNVAVEKEDGDGGEEELGVAGAGGQGGAEKGGAEGAVV